MRSVVEDELLKKLINFFRVGCVGQNQGVCSDLKGRPTRIGLVFRIGLYCGKSHQNSQSSRWIVNPSDRIRRVDWPSRKMISQMSVKIKVALD
jgi:hypothetical protein